MRERPLDRAPYAVDAGGCVRRMPGAVAQVRTAGEVAEVLRIATAEGIRVSVRGGGTTTEGETLTDGGLVLDLKGLREIRDVAPDGSSAWCEAGAYWHHVGAALKPHGLTYQGAPLSISSTVGGTLCVGGVDVNAFRYGCTADQVLELEAVLPTGGIVRCSESRDRPLFDDLLFGYGQLGVITGARLRLRPLHTISLRYFVYTDVAPAMADLMRLVREDRIDYGAVLSIMDRVFCLLVGFDTIEREGRFEEAGRAGLAAVPEWRIALREALACLARPAHLEEALYLRRRREAVLSGLADPVYRTNGRITDRVSVLGRVIWKHWGDRAMAIPDLSLTLDKLVEGARRGLDACRRQARRFTMYAVLIRNFRHRERYAVSPMPPSGDEWVSGIEFSALPDGEEPDFAALQRFKEA
ncbi:MAG: FAD-binding oxidoreductase, partial [Planctomycetes bacterium]|nr:FAD-binding oxidoreductase [Planctomycetota bacterium]